VAEASDWLKRGGGWPALLVLALAFVLLWCQSDELASVIERQRYPFQLDDSEGVILGEVGLLLAGVDIFQPVRPELFTAAPYPPLFYWLLAPGQAAGLAPFPTARAITGLTTLLLAVTAGWLVAASQRQPAAGLLTAALWLAPDLVAVWAVPVRPDLLALLVNLLGLAVVAGRLSGPIDPAGPSLLSAGRRAAWWTAERGWLQQRLGWLALAALLFALGFYFKHTALAAPAAAGLALLAAGRSLAALAFGGLYATAVLVPFGLLNWLTDGGFAQHLVAFHRSWLWQNYVDLARPWLERAWPLLPLPLLLLAVDLWRRRWPELLSLSLLTAGLVSLGGGTHGGNHNHLLETLLAAALANGAAIARLLATRPRALRSPVWSLLAAALAPLLVAGLVAGLLLEPAGGRHWLAGDLRPPSASQRLGWQQVLTVVAAERGAIYSDNVGLLLLAGQPIHYSDPFTMAGSVEAGLWSDAALVEAVRQRRFSLIALRYDVGRLRGVPTDITPGLLAAIREHYVVADRNVLLLYRPRTG
jgi:hypothetical protein